MKKFLLLPIIVLILVTTQDVAGQKLIEAGKGYSSTSVNTAVFRSNSVTSKGKFQVISYYDSDGYLTLGKRSLKDGKFMTQRSKYKGKCQDAHNVISIGIDGKGYIHVAFNHHNASLQYCMSKKPYSLELDTLKSMIGHDENRITYPEFYTLDNGDLLFAYRVGKSGQGNLVLNRYDVKNERWIRLQDNLLDGEGKRNAYWQMCVGKNGVIHLSWVWRESSSVETNHDLCYAYSEDGGVSWKKSTGELYVLPITCSNAEYAFRIPQGSELINQTSMTADQNGNPYIAGYWKNPYDAAPQYRLVFKKDGEWKMREVGRRFENFTLSGRGTKMIPISRPRLAIDSKDNVYYIFRDKERGSKVSLAYSNDPDKTLWKVRDLTDFSVDAWEPSFDTNLWNNKELLHIYVQRTSQGDGEKVKELSPQHVYVLEVER